MALPPALLTSTRGHVKNDSGVVMLGGGVGFPPPPANYQAGS